jgi:hypothetical protein
MNTSTDTGNSNLAASLATEAHHLTPHLGETWPNHEAGAHQAEKKFGQAVDGLRAGTSGSLAQAVAHAEEFTRRGWDRAREVATQTRIRAAELRGATAQRVQADPMKALLMAAAAGAAAALVVQWLTQMQPRRNR